MKIDFTNKNVLVVGASKGIGKETAKTFKSLGAIVHEISRENGIDISDKKDIDSYFQTIVSLDIIINIAAINYCKPIESINYEEWEEVITTNLTSYFYIIKKALPFMKKGGKIVNVSSIAGRNKSIVSGVHYTSSKAGIIGLTRQLAHELGPKGITVNCVCPSQTLTPMLQKSMTIEEQNNLASSIPLRRLATTQDQVGPIIFLCSSLASYVNGSIIDVNGGQL